MNDKYKIIGPLYDFLAMIFSFGKIDKCKVAMHEHIKPDDKVLFAGVGQGIDAIEAAQRGAEVTVVDLSESIARCDAFSHPRVSSFSGRLSGISRSSARAVRLPTSGPTSFKTTIQ